MRKNNIILLALLVLFSSYTASFAKDFGYFSSQDDNFKKYHYQGHEYLNKKDFNNAIKSYEEALKSNPRQMMALGELCYSYSQIEDYDKMIEIAKKGLLVAQQQISKDNIGRFYGYLGNAYKMQEKYDEAIKYLELAKYNKPYYYDNYLSLAYCYFKKKRYDGALACYDYLKSNAPDYYEENDLEKSKNIIYNGFLENDIAIKHLDAAKKYIKEKNYTSAIKEYNEILQKDPEDLTSLSELIKCEVMNNTDNINELTELCKKMLKILDKERYNDCQYYEIAYKGLGYCCKKQKNAKMLSELKKLMESLSCLKEAMTQYFKDDDAAIANLKSAIEKQKDLEEAPYNHILLDELIELYFRKREMEEAKKYISIGLNRAKKDKDKNRFAIYCKDIASYYSLLGKSNEALKQYEKGLEMTSDIDDKFKFYYGIALEYNYLKDWKTAITYLEKAKELLSKNNDVETTTDLDSMIIKYKSLID
jgi:tetratricopeptide (TPR) repeat protein